MPDDRNERRLIWWTMLGVLVAICFQILISTIHYGELVQKVDDLNGRVLRLEGVIDSHTVIK